VNWVEVGFLLVSGLLAGLVGAGAGLASLISYPALLTIGLPPLAANVSNTVALTLNGAGAIAASRPELGDQRWRVRRFAAMGALGGAAGAALLLTTPAEAFEVVVPVLVALASVVLLVRPWLTGRRPAGSDARGLEERDRRPSVSAGVALVTVYGGYFGAAAGVLLLALFGATIPESIARVNALKNLVLGCANTVAAVGFVFFAPVRWTAVLPMAVGFFVGGSLAPSVVRRIPETPLRWAIGLAGLALAVKLGADTYLA
jgi:uncharacterized protein